MKLKSDFRYTPYQDLLKKNISFSDYSKGKNYYNQLAFMFEEASSRTDLTEDEAGFIVDLVKQENTNPKFLDLACGVGRHARVISTLGYQVYGVDGSESLIQIAKSKDERTTYSVQDFRNFVIDDKVDVIYSMWESYNYLSNTEDMKKFLKCCSNTLGKGGLLVLDSRNFFNASIPREKHQQRDFKADTYQVHLDMKKRTLLEDGVHEGIFSYFITDEKTREMHIVVDQELIKIWKPAEIQELGNDSFEPFDIFGGFSLSDKYDENESKRMIIVLKKK